MAKRIIENGKYNKAACTSCNCVFAFDRTDVEESGNGYYVTCPQCGVEISVEVKNNK